VQMLFVQKKMLSSKDLVSSFNKRINSTLTDLNS